MDRKQTKKIRSARIIMTNIFMALSVVAIVFILMLIAMGFSFTESGRLEQSGLIQITSHPRGATVEIDGDTQFGRTEINKMLSSGEHNIKISKSGYDTWSETIRVDSGLLTRIEWVRLFPLNPESQKTVSFGEPRLLSFSADRKSLLYGEANADSLSLVNLQDDTPRQTKLSLTTILDIADKETARSAKLNVVAWNESGNRILLTWTTDTGTFWYLADLEHPENSVNLTNKFGYTFSKILIANDSASKLWAVVDGTLHLIDLSNAIISPANISGIEKIANNRDTVAYLSTDPITQKHTINVFREGETGSSLIVDLTDVNATNISFAMGTYWGEEWLTYNIDKTVYILGGKYPSFEKPVKNALKSIIKRELDYIPTTASHDSEQRIVAFTNNTNVFTFDFETKDYFDSSFGDATTPHWLDNYLFWYRKSNKLFVQDFDGNNARELLSDLNNELPICLSENNKWLYYFNIVESSADDLAAADNENVAETATDATETAETAATDATATETETTETTETTPITRYVLMREKLNI